MAHWKIGGPENKYLGRMLLDLQSVKTYRGLRKLMSDGVCINVKWNRAWLPIVPRVVEVSLLLLAVWWAFTVLQSNSEKTEQSPIAIVGGDGEKASLVSFKALTAVPLFGKLEATPAVKKRATAPKPVVNSRLVIKLLGTVVAGASSAAIMTVGTSIETTFFLGDVLYGRVFLKEVEADAVILSNQGSDERVSLVKEK